MAATVVAFSRECNSGCGLSRSGDVILRAIHAISSGHCPATTRSRGNPMRGKQIALTALVALVVVVGFNAYQARKG